MHSQMFKKMEDIKVYVVDTHVLIWYFIGSKRLLSSIKGQLDKIRLQGGTLLIPTIVLAEAFDLSEKKRVQFDFYKMYKIIKNEPEFEIVGFGPEIFEETIKIKKISEIHDRIIVATAKFFKAGIFTKDKIIRDSGEIKVL